jgi:hypothetical protein
MEEGSEPPSDLERQIFLIQERFPGKEAEFLTQELRENFGKAHYDPEKGRISYNFLEDAMFCYTNYQLKAMEEHKWLRSEQEGRDVGEQAAKEYLDKHHLEFRSFWKRTHNYIPSNDESKRRPKGCCCK